MREIMARLEEPFPESSISWRCGARSKDKKLGIALAYIDARDVMERLDEVFGMNWKCTYSHADKKTICEISVLIDGVWITRSNGAGDSDIEAEKGAISDAFKRAAVMFGVGRYLYKLENEFVPVDEYGKFLRKPKLPNWAKPNKEPLTDEQAAHAYQIWMNEKALLNGKDEDVINAAWFKHPSNFRSAVKAYGETLRAQQDLDKQNIQHINEIAKAA